MDILEKDFVQGLTYVAVSRVKNLRGILFKEPFDYERLKPRKKQIETAEHRERDRERRLPKHVNAN